MIDPTSAHETDFPRISNLGVTSLLVQFADQLTDSANIQAVQFANRLTKERLPGVLETQPTLASVAVRFDTRLISHSDLAGKLKEVLRASDLGAEKSPSRLWRVPTLYGGENGPNLAEAASLAGCSINEAIEELGATEVRVLTIGYAPGQPYLGQLPQKWDIPRQQTLTKHVPKGALVVAIRQFVLFAHGSPTGWRHIGQTAFDLFNPMSPSPFTLRAGDRMIFTPVSEAEFEDLRHRPNGGASLEDPS